jgi:LssY C-terminus
MHQSASTRAQTPMTRMLLAAHSRYLLSFSFLLLLYAVAGCALAKAGCEQIAAGQKFWVRLLQPVASYSSKSGAGVRGILAVSPQCDGAPVFPAGTIVEGHVGRVRKVGMGFIHESSSVELEFTRILPDDAPPIALKARVIEVDNGRERVHKGVMYGIRSTDNMQNRLTTRLMHLPTWNPSTLWVVLAYRAAIPFSPEPEVYFPPGTDLRLELAAPLQLPAEMATVLANQEFTVEKRKALDEQVLALPLRSATSEGRFSDVVNVVFLGSREQVSSAFKAAGWTGSDTVTTGSAFRLVAALAALKNDIHLPISRQTLVGKAPDSMWQKSFDSVQKRDHTRVWSQAADWHGQEVWPGATIRETGAVFSIRNFKLIHHVDVDLDAEREKVVRDLTLAGCVETVHNAPRPLMPLYSRNATGDQMSTDGDVAIVQLKDCERPNFDMADPAATLPSRPHSKFTRYLRTQVLSVRSLWRANAVYGVYDAVQLAVSAIHTQRSRDRDTAWAHRYRPVPVSAIDLTSLSGENQPHPATEP